MPDRTFYRAGGTGRFVSEEQAGDLESVTRTRTVGGFTIVEELRYGAPVEQPDESDSPEPYDLEESRWGARIGGDGILDEDRLRSMDFPGGYNAFRVTYKVGGNPRYPREYASTEWFGTSQWPPSLDMLEGIEPEGIGHIVFRLG